MYSCSCQVCNDEKIIHNSPLFSSNFTSILIYFTLYGKLKFVIHVKDTAHSKSANLTPLQMHAAFLDRDNDGIIYIKETYQGNSQFLSNLTVVLFLSLFSVGSMYNLRVVILKIWQDKLMFNFPFQACAHLVLVLVLL